MPLGISQKCRSIAPSATLAMDAKARELREKGADVISFASRTLTPPNPCGKP